jgi:hypothetical protein
MKLKIIKNKKIVDNNNKFTYIVEIFDDAGNFFDEYILKIPATKYMTPDDSTFSYEGVLNQLRVSNQEIENNFNVDSAEIEEIIIE